MIYEAVQSGYQWSLAALILWIMWQGSWPMRRTILTIAAVMGASLALGGLWPTPAYSLAMIAVNALACLIITWHPAGKWQAVIGLTYLLQIGVHIGRLAANNPDMVSFWWGLSVGAILQLFLVGGWWLHDRYSHRVGRGSSDPLAHAVHRAGVAR